MSWTISHRWQQRASIPGVVHFPQPWTTGTPEEVAINVVQNHWWARGDWRDDNWRLFLAVFHEGTVIGQQNLSARHFHTTREARTGCWLGQRFQRRGFGTQMRTAALDFAFQFLGAVRTTSTAFADNAGSRQISKKLGYAPNGIRRLAVEGRRLTEAHESAITKEQWLSGRQHTTVVGGFGGCRHMFGIPPTPTSSVDVILHV
ncbi:GNAT family N-acetyltransferase [Streptomyces decoyicus]|uniref:GNAT family N-acetyltransferase n=1 Tax=Streptomyces decoyicus TaxID=249567 RepID=UPI00386857A3